MNNSGAVMYKFIGFIVISIGFIIISWRSLQSPRSHGFYRFFAWELILVLFLLNVNSWFKNPFSWHQLISWLLLFSCLIPLGFGVHSLANKGKPAEKREGEPQLLAFEKTTQLVDTGVYRYIRHPLYCSLLLLSWGIFFKELTWYGILLVVCTTLFLFATARADEAECIQFFGPDYETYMKHTKRFVPFLF